MYVLGIGVGGMLSGRRYWRRGVTLAVISVAYSAFIVTIGADHGAPLARHYGYLVLGASASYVHGRLTTGGTHHRADGRGILRHPFHICARPPEYATLSSWQITQRKSAIMRNHRGIRLRTN